MIKIPLKNKDLTGSFRYCDGMVIPAEPALMKEEKELVEKYGIKVVNMPMMPGFSGNEETLQEAKKFIETEKGLYYVHCYLGRDRLIFFKSAAKKIRGKTSSEERHHQPRWKTKLPGPEANFINWKKAFI